MPSEAAKEDELLQGIYQDIQPSLEGVEAREFKPWHKPRKQYIRLRQWCAIVRWLIRKVGMQQGDSLRYLGLPGEDLLDIRKSSRRVRAGRDKGEVPGIRQHHEALKRRVRVPPFRT